MDAEETDFADASFDIAVAMFVASVVPHPRALLAEMRRVVRPGGNILFVNHFRGREGARAGGSSAPWPRRRARSGGIRISPWKSCLSPEDLVRSLSTPVPPFGIFTLVRLRN